MTRMVLGISLISLALWACAVDGWRVSCAGECVCGLDQTRIGSSRAVDRRGDVWIVGGFTSDERGLLVVASCANESGVCSGRTEALIRLSEIVKVRP